MAWEVDEEQGPKYLAPSTGGGWVPETGEAVPFEESKSDYNPDDELLKWGPSYKKMLTNAPESLMNSVVGVISALANIPKTAKALGRTVAGGIEKATGLGTGEHIPEWDALSGFYKERYGGLGNLYRTMENDPVGFMTDVSSVLGATGTLARSGALAKAGRLTSPLYGTAKGTGKALGEVQNYATGILSGGSPWEMRVAKKPSATFSEYLRGQKNAENVIQEVDSGLRTIKRGAQAEFGAVLDNLEQTGVPVDVSRIYSSFDNFLSKDGITRLADGTFKFIGTKYEGQPAAQNFIKSLDNVLYNEERAIGGVPYQFQTPKQADILKKTVDNIVKSVPKEAQYAKGFGTKIAEEVSLSLKEQLPGYADANMKYAKAMDFEGKIRDALGMPNRDVNVETVEGKLKGAASRKYRRDLFKSYSEKTGFDLPAAVAGMDLSGAYPRGLWARGIITYFINQGIVDPKFLAVTPYAVPRVAGELLQAQGRMGKRIPAQTPNILYETGVVEEQTRPENILYRGK